MRLRSIALAGVALICLSGPVAAGQGWYIGAEVGNSLPVDTKVKFPELPSLTGNVDAEMARRLARRSTWCWSGVWIAGADR